MKSLPNVKIVSYDVKPTKDDIKALERYTCLSVASQSTDDWYCLLRGYHGDLSSIFDCGYILKYGYSDDDIFIEYSYIVNYYTNKFEYYDGVPTSSHLVKSYNFDYLPNWEEF